MKFETICERVLELVDVHTSTGIRFREVLHYMYPWTKETESVRAAIWKLVEQRKLMIQQDTGDLRRMPDVEEE